KPEIKISLINSFLVLNQSYFVYTQYGEFDDDGQPVTSLTGPLTGKEVLEYSWNHRYTTPGKKHINVTVNDQPFIIANGPNLSGLTTSGLPAPSIGKALVVFSSNNCTFICDSELDCFDFQGRYLLPPRSQFSATGNLTLLVQATSKLNDNNEFDDEVWTRAYHKYGIKLDLTFSNYWSSYKFRLDSSSKLYNDSFWEFNFPYSYIANEASISAKVKKNLVIIGGCRVAPTTVDVTFPRLYLNSPACCLNGNIGGSNFANIVNTLRNDLFNPVFISTNPCNPSNAAMLFRTSASNYTGCIVAFTDNSFKTTKIFNLCLNEMGNESLLADSICFGLTSAQCKALEILNVKFAQKSIFYLTNYGIAMARNNANAYKFSWAPFANSTNLAIHFKENCYTEGNEELNVIVNSTSIYAASVSAALMGKWNLLNLNTTLKLISSITIPSTKANLYLFGNPINNPGDCEVNLCLYNQTIILRTFNNVLSSQQVIKTFDPSMAVVGMKLHPTRFTVFVYGEQFLRSNDGGFLFEQQFSLSEYQFNDDNSIHVFERVLMSKQDSIVVAITSHSMVFFGKVSSNKLLPMSNLPNYNPNQKHFFHLSNEGLLLALHTDFGKYNSTNGTEFGFLDLTTNSFRKDILKRIIIPRRSIYSGKEFQPLHTAVPIVKSDKNIEFVYKSLSDPKNDLNIFNSSVSSLYRVLLTQNAQPNSIAGSSIVSAKPPANLFGQIQNQLIPEAPSKEPSLTFKLNIMFTNESFVILSLQQSSSSSTEGWVFSSIGKTLIYKSLNILITDIQNKYNATGYIAHQGLVLGDLNNIPSGAYNIYDFRGFINDVNTFSQNLTVSSLVGNQYLITLDPGFMKFSTADLHKMILFNDTIGIVTNVTSNFTANVSFFTPMVSGTYASSEWMMFRNTIDYVYGMFPVPYLRSSPYFLKSLDCEVLSIETSYNTTSITIERHRSAQVWLRVAFRNDKITENIGLSVVLSNPSLVQRSSILTTSIDSGLIYYTLNVTLYDKGIVGETDLMFQLSEYSSSCTQEFSPLVVSVGCNGRVSLKANLHIDQYPSSFIDLPVNYRPPSSYGLAVPTSDNLYNADPSMPRYNDFMSVSRSSGTYKQCLGAKTRHDCTCGVGYNMTFKSIFSDCISKVYPVDYYSHYNPELGLFEDGHLTSTSSAATYILEEVNGRKDYCFTTSNNCSDFASVSSLPISPNTSIIWMGAELYHFKVFLIDGSYCNLQTEFMVYVINSPVSETTLNASLAMTTAVIGDIILIDIDGMSHHGSVVKTIKDQYDQIIFPEV
ncbi:hypothetical protein ROZALSC1DRAFT_29427, partial [Rozella allomycis CSF55]